MASTASIETRGGAAAGQWAALDLGSNSFHLLIARVDEHGLEVVERLKEKVQLLGGAADGELAEAAQVRGLDCLRRFAQRLRGVPTERVIVMGTYALRHARNTQDFLAQAAAILGVTPQVISGGEEARLIAAAVAYHETLIDGQRLVIDIGGGSTEIALADADGVRAQVSVNVGCVALNEAEFHTGEVSVAYPHARKRVQAELARVCDQELTPRSGATVCGTSGTVQSIQEVLEANGWAHGGITRAGLARLEAALVDDPFLLEAGLPGLPPERVDIFPAGVAILSAAFDALGLDALTYVDVSLLHGMVCARAIPQMGSDPQAGDAIDRRDSSVQAIASRFAMDAQQRAQGARVARCAQSLFAQASPWFEIEDPGTDELLPLLQELLDWAARLHRIGARVNARHYHRHGGYIVKHADMPGFTEAQRQALALLIRGHRRSMPGLAFRSFDPMHADHLLRLVALLRLAVILERSAHDDESPTPTLSVSEMGLVLDCGPGWLAGHPLSARELEVEALQLRGAGLALEFS